MTDDPVRILAPSGTPDHARAIGFDERTWDQPWNIARGHRTMAERMPTAVLAHGSTVPWSSGPSLDLSGLRATDPLLDADIPFLTFLDQRLMSDGLLVVHNGRVIAERYANGMEPQSLHVVHSCSKTLTAMLVGWAVDQGYLSVETEVVSLIPELRAIDAWHGVTLQHLLDMAAGVASEEHYADPNSMYWRYAAAVGYYGVQGDEIGVLAFAERELTTRACEPGTVFNYASYLSNLIPIMVERACGRDALALLQAHVYSRIGAEAPALVNVDAKHRPIVEGQVNLTLRDFARWAYLMANDGRNLAGDQVIPRQWVEDSFRSSPHRRSAFERSEYDSVFPGAEYHNQMWLLDPARGVSSMLGIHGQFAHIDRERGLMIIGMSSFADQANGLLTACLQQAWATVAAAID